MTVGRIGRVPVVDAVTGLDNVHVDVAMMRSQTGTASLITRFRSPNLSLISALNGVEPGAAPRPDWTNDLSRL
jgi:hypothetical protein